MGGLKGRDLPWTAPIPYEQPFLAHPCEKLPLWTVSTSFPAFIMGSNKSFRCEEQLSGSRVPEDEENLVHPEPLPLARMQVHTHLGENPGAHLFGTLGTSHRMVGLQGSVSGWGRGAIVLPSP